MAENPHRWNVEVPRHRTVQQVRKLTLVPLMRTKVEQCEHPPTLGREREGAGGSGTRENETLRTVLVCQ